MNLGQQKLTKLEESGLRAHGLPTDDQNGLSAAFRMGLAYGLASRIERPVAYLYDTCGVEEGTGQKGCGEVVVLARDRRGQEWKNERALCLADSVLSEGSESVVMERFKADLLKDIEEPDQALVAEFQRGFMKQLQRRKHRPGMESAEVAGFRAMMKLAMSRARESGGT